MQETFDIRQEYFLVGDQWQDHDLSVDFVQQLQFHLNELACAISSADFQEILAISRSLWRLSAAIDALL